MIITLGNWFLEIRLFNKKRVEEELVDELEHLRAEAEMFDIIEEEVEKKKKQEEQYDLECPDRGQAFCALDCNTYAKGHCNGSGIID